MITFPANFSISNLVAFAGLAGVILVNRDKFRIFNSKTAASFVAVLYILGTIGILVYGMQGGFNNVITAANADLAGTWGYYFVLFATVLLVFIFCIRAIQTIQPFILVQVMVQDICMRTKKYFTPAPPVKNPPDP
jgi:hypothetical protein